MFNSRKFIKEVEKRPSLWNKHDIDFDCREIKSRNWNEIADLMFPNWKIMKNEEKSVKGKELLLKWRNLKDTFRKIIKYDISGTYEQRKKYSKTYMYWNYLQFLRPNLENDFKNKMNSEKTTKPIAKKRKIHNDKNDTLKKRDGNNTDIDDHEEPINEDKMFFLSLVPTLLHMPLLTKIKTKIEIMQVIKKNLNESCINVNIQNEPADPGIEDYVPRPLKQETHNVPWNVDSVDIEDVVMPKVESSFDENSDSDMNNKEMVTEIPVVKKEFND